MPINVFNYLKRLGQERYRAVIIHVVPQLSPSLTVFSKKICSQKNGKYIDLLDYFIQSPGLSEKIDSYSPEKFRTLLIKESESQTLLIIDRADFLIDTWIKSERQDFYRLMNNQWDGYKDGMTAKIILCLQTSQEIEALKIQDSQGNSRVLRLSDFEDIA